MQVEILELKKFVEAVERESSIVGSPCLDIRQCLRLKAMTGTAMASLNELRKDAARLEAEDIKLRDELEKVRLVYDSDVRLLRRNLEGAQEAHRATHAQLNDEKARSIKSFNHQIGVMRNEFVVLRQQMQDEREAERKAMQAKIDQLTSTLTGWQAEYKLVSERLEAEVAKNVCTGGKVSQMRSEFAEERKAMQAKIDQLVTNTLEARRGEARAQKELSRIRGNLDEAGAGRNPNETTDEEWAQLAQLGTRVSCDMVGWWLHRAFMLGKGAPLSECMMGPHGVIFDDDAEAIMITDLEGEMKPCAER